MLYIPHGSVREAHTNKDNPMHSYAFNFTLNPSFPHNLPFQTVNKQYLTGEVLQYVKEYTQVWMTKQPGYELQARGLFLLILHRLLAISLQLEDTGMRDFRIARVQAYISDHYSEDLDLDAVAAVADLHPVYFSKLFKQVTGHSFKKFLNLIRTNNAEMLLITGGFTVSEVAERCGFKDISYFSNVFKSIKGYPPSLARR